MAGFCKQCSLRELEHDSKSLADLCPKYHTAQAVCELCGPTFVDHNGVCVYHDCFDRHGDDSLPAL